MAAKINWHRYGTKLRHCRPMYWHESVKPLQYYCSCLPVSILLPTKKLLFWNEMLCSGNMIWQSVVMPVSSLWQRNSTVNLTTLFALVLLVLSTASGFIFLNQCSHYYVFLYHFVCVIVCVSFFIVHTAFVSVKLMMMITRSTQPCIHPGSQNGVSGLLR